MIDYLALALTHALLIVALLRLLKRGDIDREEPYAPMSEAEVEAARAAKRDAAQANTPAGRRRRSNQRGIEQSAPGDARRRPSARKRRDA